MRVAKRAVGRAFEDSLHAALLDERRAFAALLQTADAREGVAPSSKNGNRHGKHDEPRSTTGSSTPTASRR